MASALNMEGKQITNGSPGVASTDFVVMSQLTGGGGGPVDRSQSAEMLLVGLLSKFGIGG